VKNYLIITTLHKIKNMKYIAPDKTVIVSDPTKEVKYTSACEGIADGIYESTETKGSINPVGIEQIKIVRKVSNNVMEITITETSEADLILYKAKAIEESNNNQI